jgi:hypothetical protein
MDDRENVGAKTPVGHNLDQAALFDEARLDDRRKVADSRSGDQRGAKPARSFIDR